MYRLFAIVLGWPLAAAPPLPVLVTKIQAEVRPEEAMQFMRDVYSTDRWFSFPKFHQTAGNIQKTLTRLGLSHAEIVETQADGVTQAGFWTMPMAWDIQRGRLELLDKDAPENLRILADYDTVPSSIGMWSGPTPPGGITADLVEWNKDLTQDFRGKLVLTSENSAGLKWQLVKAGALGAVNAFTENPALLDGRQWINAWGDNGWAFTKTSTPLLSFSITPRQATYVRKLLAEGKRIQVHAAVNSRYYAGSYPYTTAVIEGSGSEEEVLTLGHTSEQGAQDNATGVAALMESLAALNRLIESGKLPRPLRTIRILLMPEMYGTLDYVARYPDRVRRTVAAMCVDTPAASYDLPGTEYTFNLNPDVAKSYLDAFALQVAQEYLPRVARPWHSHPYRSGTDAYLGEPSVGIPTTWPYGGSGVETHHNSEDTPDRVDPRSLRDLAIINASYLYYLASAGEPEALWLAAVSKKSGLEQIEKAEARSPEQVTYAVNRETQAILSVLRLVPETRRPALREQLLPFIKELRRKDPESIVVKRTRFGTIPLDELAPDQREGYPSGAWAAVPTIALYWCDGHRNLAEVIRLTKLELGSSKFDFVGYFQFLRKHGYVEFVE